MNKTLVLVVDRDDDFGVKAGVQTPAVGPDAVLDAARRLGIADPEDSDVNTVYAAVKIYNELREDGRGAEVALICGDTKIGHRSDMKVADELDAVLEKVSPDRAILVSDGAEDEYVYPMIISRIKVDSVKKVYVKQAPGLEGAFYVLMKILKDDDKRKRLLAPLGFILMAISIILLIPPFLSFRSTGDLAYMYNSIGYFVTLAVGLIICGYAYKIDEWMMNYAKRLLENIKAGDPTVIFSVVAIMLLLVGIILGLSASFAESAISDGQRMIIFLSNSLWVLVFAYICNDFGKFLERYVEEKKIVLGFLVGTLMMFAAAFVIQAMLDSLAVAFGYNIIGNEMIMIEFIIAFAFAAVAAMTQISYKRFLNARKEIGELSDALL